MTIDASKDEVWGHIEYRTDLFGRRTIEAFVKHFEVRIHFSTQSAQGKHRGQVHVCVLFGIEAGTVVPSITRECLEELLRHLEVSSQDAIIPKACNPSFHRNALRRPDAPVWQGKRSLRSVSCGSVSRGQLSSCGCCTDPAREHHCSAGCLHLGPAFPVARGQADPGWGPWRTVPLGAWWSQPPQCQAQDPEPQGLPDAHRHPR